MYVVGYEVYHHPPFLLIALHSTGCNCKFIKDISIFKRPFLAKSVRITGNKHQLTVTEGWVCMHVAQLTMPVAIFIMPCEFLLLFTYINMSMYSYASYTVGN
jgi:hypothetical protein